MDDLINQLEIKRKRAAKLITIVIIASSVVTLFGLYLFSKLGVGSSTFILAILLGIVFGILLATITGCFKAYTDYKHSFKITLVEVPFQNAFPQATYDDTRGIDQSVIENTGIMKMSNIYYSNDYVKGCYKGVEFERADVTIEHHVRSGKTSYTITYLKGRWLIFEFNKDFHYDLQIISCGFTCAQEKKTFFTEAEERRHKVKFEDIDFNKRFEVYCQDEHEAYYILTPQLMQVLKNMDETMDGSFMLGFVDNQLHIAIHNNKDAMEPKVFENIDLEAVSADVQNEINVIINIIEGMTLDRDTFMANDGE